MDILFLSPRSWTPFPKPDSPTTFADWLAFSEKHQLNEIKYFDSLDDLLKKAKKTPLSPILISHAESSVGNRLHFMKRQGKRVFGINNHDYADTLMSHTYAIPLECDTFDELKSMITLFGTNKKLTHGILKAPTVGYRDGQLIEV